MEVEKCYSQVVQDLLSVEWSKGGSMRPMPRLKTFISYDCSTPIVKEELENLFAQNAAAWEKKDMISWILSDGYEDAGKIQTAVAA